MGCIFEFNSGEIVDVELPPTDIPLFDHWRVVQFLKSHGEVGTHSEIEVARLNLADIGGQRVGRRVVMGADYRTVDDARGQESL